jgi:hypothetical protein
MKMSVDIARFPCGQPKVWLAGLAVVLAVHMLTAGCGKSSGPAPSAPQPPSSETTNSSATAPPVPASDSQPAVRVDTDGSQTNLQILNRALMGWMIKNHRHPENFADFASTANIQIPDSPAGEKYTLNDRGFIILVSGSPN